MGEATEPQRALDNDRETSDAAGSSGTGEAVWRAGHERAVSHETASPEPYGPENDTVRPVEDRPRRTTRGRPAADDQGISG